MLVEFIPCPSVSSSYISSVSIFSPSFGFCANVPKNSSGLGEAVKLITISYNMLLLFSVSSDYILMFTAYCSFIEYKQLNCWYRVYTLSIYPLHTSTQCQILLLHLGFVQMCQNVPLGSAELEN